MPAQKPKTVVNVTFQDDEWDYDERVSLAGHRFRLVRVGTSGDAAAAEDLVAQLEGAGLLVLSVDNVERHGCFLPFLAFSGCGFGSGLAATALRTTT